MRWTKRGGHTTNLLSSNSVRAGTLVQDWHQVLFLLDLQLCVEVPVLCEFSVRLWSSNCPYVQQFPSVEQFSFQFIESYSCIHIKLCRGQNLFVQAEFSYVKQSPTILGHSLPVQSPLVTPSCYALMPSYYNTPCQHAVRLLRLWAFSKSFFLPFLFKWSYLIPSHILPTWAH